MRVTSLGHKLYAVDELFVYEGKVYKPRAVSDCGSCAFNSKTMAAACALHACGRYDDRPAVAFVRATGPEAVACKLTNGALS